MKKPLIAELNRTRRIGCEFEMTIPVVGTGGSAAVRQTLARVLSANGLRAIARDYTHSDLPPGYDLAIESDSSIEGERRYQAVSFYSSELKTRPLVGTDDWEAVVPKALSIAKYLGARVNRSTGHHIHLEVLEIAERPKVIRNIANIVFRFERVLYGLVPPSRKENGYAIPMSVEPVLKLRSCRSRQSFDRVLQSCERHHGLNLTHLTDPFAPRLELRYAAGTLDVDKARHWLRFCLQMVQHACNRNCQKAREQVPNDRRGLEALLVTCGFKCNSGIYSKVSPELRETGRWLIKRWKHFNGSIPLQRRKDEVK